MDLIQHASRLAIAAGVVLSFAPSAWAAGAVAETLEASGGMTLGSMALIGLAGAVIVFGNSRGADRQPEVAPVIHNQPNNHRNQGLLRTAPQEEFHHES